MNAVNLLIGGLAVWRLSHALVKEHGPLMIFSRLRARLARTQKRSGGLFDLISCVYCTSFWIGLLGAFWTVEDIIHWVGYALAFSAISIILEVLTNNLNTLPIVTPPATDNKILVGTRTAPKQRNDVVRYPDTSNGSVTVEADTTLDS